MGGRVLMRGFNPKYAFSSILDAPNALEILNKDPFRGKGPADENGHRDQSVYLTERKATDKWLREQSGIKNTDRDNPVFFGVAQYPKQLMMMNSAFASHTMIMPLSVADEKQWTFTAGDSMGNFYAAHDEKGLKEKPSDFFLQDNNPEHGTVKNMSQLEKAMDKYPTTAQGEPRNFEAQYWGPAFDPAAMGGMVFSGGQQIKNTAEVTLGANAHKEQGVTKSAPSAANISPKL